MDYIKPELGGFGFVLDDIDFIQESTKQALEAMLKPYTNRQPSFIYTGCKVSLDIANSTFSFSEGWVVVDGELLHFEGVTIPTATFNGEYIFERSEIDIQLDSSIKTKDDNSTYYAYKKVKAVLSNGLSGNANVDSNYWSTDNAIGSNNWYYFEDVLKGKSNSIDLVGNWDSFSERAPIYRKDINGMIQVNGKMPDVGNPSNSYSLTIGTLPVGFRPKNDLLGMYVQESNIKPVRIAAATGEITIVSNPYPSGKGELIFPLFEGV